jgi:hypothetical protein
MQPPEVFADGGQDSGKLEGDPAQPESVCEQSAAQFDGLQMKSETCTPGSGM